MVGSRHPGCFQRAGAISGPGDFALTITFSSCYSLRKFYIYVNALVRCRFLELLRGRKKNRRKNMKKYRCSVCGYIYDPAVGDADSGVAAGTAFEDLPDGWTCPVCGAEKDAFEPVD